MTSGFDFDKPDGGGFGPTLPWPGTPKPGNPSFIGPVTQPAPITVGPAKPKTTTPVPKPSEPKTDTRSFFKPATGTAGTSGPTKRTLYSNPPFAPEIRRLIDITTGGNLDLQRGFIKTDENALPNGFGNVFYLFFLYNPSVINLSHVADAQTSVYRRTEDIATQRMRPMQQTLTFSLLFDRLYDVMEETELDARYQGARMSDLGVYADVLTLYDMLGITKNLEKTEADPKAAEGSDELAPVYNNSTGEFGKDYAMRPVGPMLYTACRFYFSKQLIFRGVITGLDISYTHWTAAMVPNRCTVNINVELLPEDDSKTSPGNIAQEAWNKGGEFRRAADYISNLVSIGSNGKWRYTPGGGGMKFE